MSVPEHEGLTPMGAVERAGEFARGVNRAEGWRRHVGKAIAVALLAPFAFLIYAFVRGLFGD